jgi:hypothetical protein
MSCLLGQNEPAPEASSSVVSENTPIQQLRIRTPVYRPYNQEDPYNVNPVR